MVRSWATGPMLGMDLETTGVDPLSDRAVTISLVWVEPGREPEVHEWLVDPGVDIPTSASDVHGITTEMAREKGMPPADAWAEVFPIIRERWSPDVPLIAYNIAYDATMADHELQRHLGISLPAQDRYCVDPMVIGRHLYRDERGRFPKGGWKLGVACQRFGVALSEADAHNSTNDVLATMRLAYKMAARWPRPVGLVALDRLHASQHVWHREWATRFSGWLNQQAAAMEAAWRRGDVELTRSKLIKANVRDVDPSDENVSACLESTRAAAADIAASAGHWPMRRATDTVPAA